MHCLILFRDHAGQLPTAQELRRCGFEVSAAALPRDESPPLPAQRPELALAAEPTAPYGNSHNHAARPESPHAGQVRHVMPKPLAAEPALSPVAEVYAADGSI